MNRTTVVPKPISETIRQFVLSREMVIRLLTRMHSDVPNDYLRFRHFRVKERYYRYRMVIGEANGLKRHLFTFVIDDTSSPDHLIVSEIGHYVK